MQCALTRIMRSSSTARTLLPGRYPLPRNFRDLALSSSNSVSRSGRTVPLLSLAAIAVSIGIVAVGTIYYSAALRLNESRDWLEHTQAVASDLQQQAQRLDRIESALRIYDLTQSADTLALAQSNTVAFDADAVRIAQMVDGDSVQSLTAQELTREASSLEDAVASLTPRASIPSGLLPRTRQTLAAMEAAERDLLAARAADVHDHETRSLITGGVFIVLSVLLIMGLFGFLLRDARRRRHDKQHLSETNDKLERTVRELERKMREANLIKLAGEELHLCVNLDQAKACFVRYFEDLLPATSGSICLINQSRHAVERAASWSRVESLSDTFALDTCCGLRSGRPRWRRRGESEVHCGHFDGTPPEHYVCIPLAAQSETLGIVYIECPSTGIAALVEANELALKSLCELVSMTLASLNLRGKLEDQSIRDGLTGLFNRHFMEIALDRELRRAARHQKEVAVLMLDVDHFKQFNDTFGHEAGDNVLREVAEIFRQAVRTEDIICRYGGEEFVIILPEVGINDALERAEAIRRLVGDIRLHYRGRSLREVTISVGVALYPQNAESVDQILRVADHALYEAKDKGRNRIVLAPQQVALLD
jgi:diguanylate cyclase (GGDEF)-like protein